MLHLIGEGRMGGSLSRAARAGHLDVSISGRGFDPERLAGDEVLICVPDGSIHEVAERIGAASIPPRLVGHTSGATKLEAVRAAAASDGNFSIHPLQTVPDSETSLRGAPAAVAGSTPEAADFARGLASTLGLEPFAVPEDERALYHAAASIASNFLIALEETAAELMLAAGVERPHEVLTPLVRRTVDNWSERGSAALTGPVARGDEETIAMHRDALGSVRPDLLDFYDCMVDRTASVARSAAASVVSTEEPA